MKTTSVKNSATTQTELRWDDLSIPIACIDQHGIPHLITAGEVIDYSSDDEGFSRVFAISNLVTGETDYSFYESPSEIVRLYRGVGKELRPVKVNIVIEKLLKASL